MSSWTNRADGGVKAGVFSDVTVRTMDLLLIAVLTFMSCLPATV